MKNYKFILSGGGTGGHIYPAIAIADALKEKYPQAEFLFVGSQDRMEMEKVPKAGYKIEGLWIAGIQRKLTWSNLMFPFKLISSLFKSATIIRRFKPDVVIGTGGFASGPLLEMATRYNVPALIQEQNSFAGITNKLLAKKVQKICVAYDGMQQFFPQEKIIKTGNPVRQDLIFIDQNREEGLTKYGLKPQKKTLLILGGSLGARAINKLIDRELQFILDQNVQVIWQSGQLYFEEYKTHSKTEDVQVLPYIDTMSLAYAAADIIISRAGAGSVSELALVGKPVIFIPSPNVAEDHQTKNAEAIVEKDAAILLKEKELENRFEEIFKELVEDEERQAILGTNFKKIALPQATQQIVNEVEKLLK
ncbi:undecaprenyldiphospho-muramoylpentapeptide beta-N-acetylglucosaminyltransferase [Leeuwenhoekiella polynyae]|uniref:UDP-N-acetylglucosamine--N-acetylmuramyl-(pentapeptide) pyrophosphoryl-undecaprenol N-acetylglucosamine transferase n=1 Tax=Leeuwenhoekiella polynyae TaxID=1550906 RepID=A0A4Q0PER7_9FLAO|nr:undecaprenyldiphospho-muramoylpentapeptide beta-N-acetylglucosaminyltransferase [Leeuwenhoekiella polynyae]RXG25334.1 UDP-N-acetylglucosamine-N-acetylmuramylpentapeptide N-acetylglucosamine transferase [Leeuwenhoekiella polynyae]